MDYHIEQLAKLFLKFPGIGSRQAKRFAQFIASAPKSYVDALAHSLVTTHANVETCGQCFRIFEGDSALCGFCSDPTRDNKTIVVVEKSSDIESFLSTDYKGLFFVFGGLVPITSTAALQGVRMKILAERVKKDIETNTLNELILAFPLTPNGDHTDTVVREQLSAFNTTITITSLGRGLSIGTELEYADPLSLNASLKKRE